MATLMVLQGPDKGRTYRTLNEIAVLGRESDQIPLTDRTVSRRHAELHPENGDWILHDCNSVNGSYVNGVRIRKPVKLKHGDQIKIGATLLVYAGDQSRTELSPAHSPRDLIDLDVSSASMDSAILSSVSSEESVIIAGPELAEAAKAWHVMSELSSAIGAIMDPDQLLERVMDVIREELPVDHGFILMYDRESGDLIPRVVRSRRSIQASKQKITTSKKIIQHVIDTREAVLCTNAMTDARFAQDAAQDSIHSFGLRSVICSPIMVRSQLMGVIHIDSAAGAHTYTREQLRLMGAIGQMTGLAIQNAELVHQQMQTARLAATGETVAYLSHSIKNVLQALQGGAEIVEMGLKKQTPGTIAQGWAIVQRNLANIMQMTLNMLNFSKTREPNLRPCNLNHIVTDVITGLQRKADEQQVMLLTDLEEPFPPIPLDADGIEQATMNLISNAIEAVAAKTGVVNVSTRFNAKEAIADLIVSDNGPGIEPNKIETLFEPFKSTKGQGGTGLGLPVARKIVREHHGRIVVESTPGKGTVFRVRLPVQQMPQASGETYSNVD
ncbi:MAG TPA: ATP-binding protein [Phycisphaerae bacterium]|nr:ATP-binding protein [Phycisphaerae bacterium]HRY67944.1 ATP-binding protein [Phycisphaerae bacterium]HSA26681.1 ATP-binding protein [Phycisphaerae bacterium]